MKTVDIWLPYFKQGDDLGHCLDYFKGDIPAALEADASNLKAAAQTLLRIKEIIEETDTTDQVSIYADTHHIDLTGPDDVIQCLINEGIGEEPEYWEEEEGDYSD